MRWHLLKVKVKDKEVEVPDILESDSLYKILRCTAHGRPTGRYLAFAPRVNDRPIQIGMGYNDSKAAKEACEGHLKAARNTHHSRPVGSASSGVDAG